MGMVLANSPAELEQIDALLDKNIPSYRQAYSDRTAWLMACLSELAYIDKKENLEPELSNLRMKVLEAFDSDGTQAILVSFGKSIALAFRGTESNSIKDIKADVKAKTTQCETDGKIHSGFKEAFDTVASDIQNRIDQRDLQNKPLFITGHSLGGALATIAAKKLSHQGGIAACYTFGSPRVGDDEWIAGIKTPI